MKRLFFCILLILPNFLLCGQSEMKAKIFYPKSLQLEEIFYDFIEEEKGYPYYGDSITYQLSIIIHDSTYLCEFRAGISHFSNDSIFTDYEYMIQSPQQYILLNNRLVQVYVYNDGNLSPHIPFIRSSNDYCTVIGYVSNNQFDEIIDDSIIPAIWEFSYNNEGFHIINKYKPRY